MECRECGSETFAVSGGWRYCKNCGRVLGVADYPHHDYTGEY